MSLTSSKSILRHFREQIGTVGANKVSLVVISRANGWLLLFVSLASRNLWTFASTHCSFEITGKHFLFRLGLFTGKIIGIQVHLFAILRTHVRFGHRLSLIRKRSFRRSWPGLFQYLHGHIAFFVFFNSDAVYQFVECFYFYSVKLHCRIIGILWTLLYCIECLILNGSFGSFLRFASACRSGIFVSPALHIFNSFSKIYIITSLRYKCAELTGSDVFLGKVTFEFGTGVAGFGA